MVLSIGLHVGEIGLLEHGADNADQEGWRALLPLAVEYQGCLGRALADQPPIRASLFLGHNAAKESHILLDSASTRFPFIAAPS